MCSYTAERKNLFPALTVATALPHHDEALDFGCFGFARSTPKCSRINAHKKQVILHHNKDPQFARRFLRHRTLLDTLICKVIIRGTIETNWIQTSANTIVEDLPLLEKRRFLIAKHGDKFAALIVVADSGLRVQNPKLKLAFLISWTPQLFAPAGHHSLEDGFKLTAHLNTPFLFRTSTSALRRSRPPTVRGAIVITLRFPSQSAHWFS
jgi:hypothetical protein